MSKKKKEYSSTYERLKEDPTFEKDLKIRYKDFILSELILAIQQDDRVYIRKLFDELGISP